MTLIKFLTVGVKGQGQGQSDLSLINDTSPFQDVLVSKVSSI